MMSGINVISSQSQPSQESFFFSMDPTMSLIFSQNPISQNFTIQRGPNYNAYAQLRESRLKLKLKQQQEHVEEPKKRVTFQSGVVKTERSINMVSNVARSVPDFSAVLRKENRKPLEITPTTSSLSKYSKVGLLRSLGGSKSASGVEKRGGGGGTLARKSYASFEELKGIASGVAAAINEEGGKGSSSRGSSRTILGHRQY
ncbi:hypothetical protein GIB67_037501 [Kingdonia uniflora]|uniref:Uncharacterized protein n=1 Tax=Kingdonia uniflora TaxID=39325 RepID=A0A7J7KXG9_9MAGN|nr:hypothetical protein GIB67_037501 [Kingdonia uniflora]